MPVEESEGSCTPCFAAFLFFQSMEGGWPGWMCAFAHLCPNLHDLKKEQLQEESSEREVWMSFGK